ncbi:HAD-IA family hydrolase [Tropicimonas sp.]|uniref:HAD-IA family hydrolase n=1 Tax=Tropicimonas sp. TaxID=2067044 RepID=UPI003A8A0D54
MNIVFDLDGTLIDSARDIQAVSDVILGRLGKPGLTLDEVRAFVGEGAQVLVSRMMAARGIEETPETHARIYGEFVAQYEFAVDKAVFYPGVVDALALLKTQGHRLGLCTNKPELPARSVMRHMRLAQVFDGFIAGGMIDSRKPAPDMLFRVIDDMGGGPTLYVGDSEIDAETAQNAQIPFALYTEGYRKTPVERMRNDWAFDHFDRLPGIVDEARMRATAAE